MADTFYWLGKSTSFWYMTVYTGFVVYLSGRQLWRNKSPYSLDKSKKLSKVQKQKWISILLSQFIFFYFVPYILPYLKTGGEFFNDIYAPVNKNAYIYVYNGFTSIGGFAYIFIIVPVVAWFFGKRYCSWFCACGNLAEAAGLTKWGKEWVEHYTPRGKTSQKLEVMQLIFLVLAIFFGLVLFFDAWQIFSSPTLTGAWRHFQDLIVDLMFGSIIGVGAYPFLGTRIWCRYGCPMAQLMKVYSKYTKSPYGIKANSSCKGLNLCNTVCPVGIDVASFAHSNGVPKEGFYGQAESTCISCGGCIDICPVQALSFQRILNPQNKKSLEKVG